MRTLILLLASYALIPFRANAADFCVSSIDELYSAMAAVNGGAPGESHRIRIVSGDYSAAEFLGFGPNGGLTLEGGYDANCAHHSPGIGGTVIRNAREGEYHDISIHAFGGNLVVSDLVFDDFGPVYVFPQGAGHTLSVSRAAFVLAAAHGSVEMHTDAGTPMHLENVLVDGTSAECTMLASGSEMDFVTVINRGSGGGVCLYRGDLTLRNSIVYSVDGTDIALQEPNTMLHAASSVFEELEGNLDPLSSANLAGPVPFEATNDPILRSRPADIPGQIARDSAVEIALVETDLLGNPRVVGAAPDRGAFEIQPRCDLLFRGAFDSNDPCRSSGHSRHARPACLACP